MSYHLSDDPKPTLRVLEIPILYPSLDDVQRGRHDQGCAGSGDGGDEVLHPARFVVVLQFVEILFCKGGATEELGGYG